MRGIRAMTFKKLSKILLIGLVLLVKPTETVNGCDPGDPWEIFMTGSRFVIGEIVDIDGLDILLDVADYFVIDPAVETEITDPAAETEIIDPAAETEITDPTVDPEITTSEMQRSHIANIDDIDNSQRRTENFNIDNSQSRIANFNQGDYVIVSFGGEDGVSRSFCDTAGTEIFHVTSLDYETLHVKHHREHIARMLTDFVYNRGTYTYDTWSRGTRVYRQHRWNPEGWLLIYDLNSLILGNIITLEEEKFTIEIWDYVTSNGEELAFEHVTLYWEYSHHRSSFEDFNVGDSVAVTVQLPNQLPTEDDDARVLAVIEISIDVFSINILDDGSMQLERVQEDSGLSALYTDLLQHRGNYSYVVTFGSLRRYESIDRLVDDELIRVYQQGRVMAEPVDLTVATETETLTEPEDLTRSTFSTTSPDVEELEDRAEIGAENLTPSESSSSWATLVFASVGGIGGVMGVAVALLVVKIRK